MVGIDRRQAQACQDAARYELVVFYQ